MNIDAALPMPAGSDQFDCRLARLSSLSSPSLVLSAYLAVDPGAGHRYYPTLLRDLASQLWFDEPSPQADAMRREVGAAQEFLEKRRFDAPALAVFSSQPAGVFDVWRLAEPVTSALAVRETAWLDPLQAQLTRHPPALVAAAGKEEVRMLRVLLGEVEEVVRTEGTPISRHKQGGWSADIYQRRQDEHARQNLQRAADLIVRLHDAGAYRRLHLAGPPEARAQLAALLPPRVKAMIGHRAPLPLDVKDGELRGRVLALAWEAPGPGQ